MKSKNKTKLNNNKKYNINKLHWRPRYRACVHSVNEGQQGLTKRKSANTSSHFAFHLQIILIYWFLFTLTDLQLPLVQSTSAPTRRICMFVRGKRVYVCVSVQSACNITRVSVGNALLCGTVAQMLQQVSMSCSKVILLTLLPLIQLVIFLRSESFFSDLFGFRFNSLPAPSILQCTSLRAACSKVHFGNNLEFIT